MNNLLVAYDFSGDSDKAAQLAIKLAERFDAHVWMLHVVEPEPEFVGFKAGPGVVRGQVAQEMRKEHQELQLVTNKLKEVYSQITPIAVQGPTVDTILSQAEKLKAEMIFIGSRGKNKIETILLGSVSEKVVHRSSKPVVVCR